MQQEGGSYSQCRTTLTAQWWERGWQDISITMHPSLLALNTCWAVEQKLSKKELLLLAVLHSSCSDSEEGQHCSPTQGLPRNLPPHRQGCRMDHSDRTAPLGMDVPLRAMVWLTKVVLGHRFDLVISEVFSNPMGSVMFPHPRALPGCRWPSQGTGKV